MATCSVIPNHSCTANSYKRSAFISYINRAYNVCSPEFLNEELSNIETIARDAGFRSNFVKNLIIKKHQPRSPGPLPAPPIGSIDYIPRLSEKLKRILKDFNVNIAFKVSGKLNKLTNRKIDCTDPLHKRGVYEIPFVHNGVKNFYIGMTERWLNYRIKEHINDIKLDLQKSALSRLNSKANIEIMFNEARVIAGFTNYKQTLLRETLEIQLRKGEICNDFESVHLDKSWKKITETFLDTKFFVLNAPKIDRTFPSTTSLQPAIGAFGDNTDDTVGDKRKTGEKDEISRAGTPTNEVRISEEGL
ncbi:dna-directed rna mitochondrial-like protein [Lasius niger]|uniref:Dna-directed rna mitochondrial-like protein n=1 Tax=Lasius niger TaxID=67767 RepID=A0A0J7JWJ0_LASNI|nr:dna-directed rna mitochondrial-like protein [Lasius niger]